MLPGPLPRPPKPAQGPYRPSSLVPAPRAWRTTYGRAPRRPLDGRGKRGSAAILENDVRQGFTSLPAPPYFTPARSNGTLKFALREPAGPNPSGGSTISAIVSSPFSSPVGKSMMIVAE